MAKNPNLIYFNFNPYKQHIDDCAIRSIVAATGLSYKEVCRRLGVAFTRGKGLRRNRGIDLHKIEEVFDEYFDIVEDYYDNFQFVPDEFKGSEENAAIEDFEAQNGIDSVSGTTLNEFCDQFDGQGTFLVSLEGNPKADNPTSRKGGHIVCVKLGNKEKKKGFIDTWDPGEMRVDAYMRLKKKEPINSPLHWKYDFDKHEFIV